MPVKYGAQPTKSFSNAPWTPSYGKQAIDISCFPSAADHDIENDGGCGDDDQKDGEEFEEDAVLHVLLILFS